MANARARAKVLEKLLESLENAETGSRDLDIIVTFVLGDIDTEAGKTIQLLVEEDYPWSLIAELLDETLPRYTDSLDTRIPGEAITLSAYSTRRGRWLAVHRPSGGGQMIGWAATESLARRVAALKGLARALAGEPGRAETDEAGVRTQEPAEATPRRHRPPAPAPATPAAGEREELNHGEENGAEEEWKILF